MIGPQINTPLGIHQISTLIYRHGRSHRKADALAQEQPDT
jgi:hypothetical protein